VNSFLILFVSILIISITPASAALISGSNTNKGLDTVNNDINVLKGFTGSLNSDMDYMKTRAGDINWKFWKWPGIIRDISNSAYHLADTAQQMQNPANKLKNDINTLETTYKDIENDNCIDLNVNIGNMTEELSKRLNITIASETVSADQIQIDDIVQYKNQDKYDVYLKIINTTQNTNIKSRNTDYTLEFIAISIGTTVNLLDKDAYTRFNWDKTTGITSDNIIQESVKIQQEKIDEAKNSSKEYKKHSDNLLIAASVFTGYTGGIGIMLGAAYVIGSLLIATGVGIPVGIALCAISGYIGWVYAPAMVLLAVCSVGLWIAYGTCWGLYKKYDNEATTAQSYLSAFITENTKPIDVYFETYDGIPIVKKALDDPKWETLPFNLLKKPDHGDLLDGPGIQFLYGPNDGYTGVDTFELYTIKDLQIQKINVHITIKPISTFDIPTGGK
jgi:hypothetical protein